MSASIQHTINCKGQIIDLSTPIVMGILNTTPDSFYDGGKFNGVEEAVNSALKMLSEGAQIIDVGGYSSRPGADDVPITVEIERTLPVITAILKKSPSSIISIDTFRAEVAQKAIKAGAAIVNDISAGDDDPNMLETVASLNVPYILMHKKGTSKTMQNNPKYENVVQEVFNYLANKIVACQEYGIKDLIIDPGLGFGKSLVHNYQIVKHLERFTLLERPVLVGASRKSMIKQVLEVDSASSLNGTSVINTLALQNGASILRVHDPLEAQECIQLISFYNGVQ
jgi:dihydropteroate synthase